MFQDTSTNAEFEVIDYATKFKYASNSPKIIRKTTKKNQKCSWIDLIIIFYFIQLTFFVHSFTWITLKKRMNKLIFFLFINALIHTKITYKAQQILALKSQCQANCNRHGTCTRSTEIKGLHVII